MENFALNLFINKSLFDKHAVQFMPLGWLHDALAIDNAYNPDHGYVANVEAVDQNAMIIDLHFLPHAMESLLGGWQLQLDGTLFWQQGLLIQAIENGYRDLTIKNIRPLNDNILHIFKKIRDHQLIKLTDGRFYQIPKDLNFNWSEDPVALDDLTSCISAIYKKVLISYKQAELLTLERLATMLQNYEFSEGQCDIKPGWLAAYNDKTLAVNVPLTLPIEAWYYFLKQCNMANISVIIYAARGVKLPDAIKQYVSSDTKLAANSITHMPNLYIYHSDDPDVTLHSLPEQYRHAALIIDVNEASDVEEFGLVEATKTRDRTVFIQHYGNIAKFFDNKLDKKSLIIKGKLNRQWQDLLSEAIITKQFRGTLIIINQQSSALPFLADQHDIISVTRKKQYLQAQGYNNIESLPADLIKSLAVADLMKILQQPEEILKYAAQNLFAANQKVMDISVAANNSSITTIRKSS